MLPPAVIASRRVCAGTPVHTARTPRAPAWSRGCAKTDIDLDYLPPSIEDNPYLFTRSEPQEGVEQGCVETDRLAGDGREHVATLQAGSRGGAFVLHARDQRACIDRRIEAADGDRRA